MRLRRSIPLSLAGFALAISTVATVAWGQVTPDPAKDPVLFVHRSRASGGNGTDWSPMEARLLAEGWPAHYLFAMTIVDGSACISQEAEEVNTAARAHLERVNAINTAMGWPEKDRLDLVSHSMGGPITRYFMKFLQGAAIVRNYVSIGAGHHGTQSACQFPPDLVCALDDVCPIPPRGAVLDEINADDETLPGPDEGMPILYTAIWSPQDGFIVPACGSTLLGARNVEVEYPATLQTNHFTLLADPRVIDLVVEGLNGDGQNDDTLPRPCSLTGD